jgi:streptogramin lyase
MNTGRSVKSDFCSVVRGVLLTASLAIGHFATAQSPNVGATKDLFTASPLTQEGAFTKGIEGPACDRDGNIYAVNFARERTIGKITPDGNGEILVVLPDKSVGNGIVFQTTGVMFVADYVGHNVLRIDPKTRDVSVFAHNEKMNQPNDLAIAPDGTLYAAIPIGRPAPANCGVLTGPEKRLSSPATWEHPTGLK